MEYVCNHPVEEIYDQMPGRDYFECKGFQPIMSFEAATDAVGHFMQEERKNRILKSYEQWYPRFIGVTVPVEELIPSERRGYQYGFDLYVEAY